MPLCLCASDQLSVISYQFFQDAPLFLCAFVPLCLCAFPPLCLSSKEAEDAQFGAQALVVVVLGVGFAFFLDQDQLGAESEEGDGAVEDRELVGA